MCSVCHFPLLLLVAVLWRTAVSSASWKAGCPKMSFDWCHDGVSSTVCAGGQGRESVRQGRGSHICPGAQPSHRLPALLGPPPGATPAAPLRAHDEQPQGAHVRWAPCPPPSFQFWHPCKAADCDEASSWEALRSPRTKNVLGPFGKKSVLVWLAAYAVPTQKSPTNSIKLAYHLVICW